MQVSINLLILLVLANPGRGFAPFHPSTTSATQNLIKSKGDQIALLLPHRPTTDSNALFAQDNSDQPKDVLPGEFGENVFYESYINMARSLKGNIENRSQKSPFMENLYRKQSDAVHKLSIELASDVGLSIYNNSEENEEAIHRHVICLILTLDAYQKYTQQLVLTPMLAALKQMRLFESEYRPMAKPFIDTALSHYSAKKTSALIEHLGLQEFANRIYLKTLANSNQLNLIQQAKEAITLTSSMAALDLNGKNEVRLAIKKVMRTSEIIGFKALNDLLIDSSLLKEIYYNSQKMLDQMNLEGVLDQETIIRSLNLEGPSSQMTKRWFDAINVWKSKLNFFKLKKGSDNIFPELASSESEKETVFIYSPDSDDEAQKVSEEALVSLIKLYLPKPNLMILRSHIELIEWSKRFNSGLLVFADANLDIYKQQIKNLKPTVSQLATDKNWHILASGRSSLIFFDEIVKRMEHGILCSPGFSIIPGRAGQSYIPNQNRLKLCLPNSNHTEANLINKGCYFKTEQDKLKSNGKLFNLSKYHSDGDLCAAIAIKSSHGTILATSIIFDQFLSYFNADQGVKSITPFHYLADLWAFFQLLSNQ